MRKKLRKLRKSKKELKKINHIPKKLLETSSKPIVDSMEGVWFEFYNKDELTEAQVRDLIALKSAKDVWQLQHDNEDISAELHYLKENPVIKWPLKAWATIAISCTATAMGIIFISTPLYLKSNLNNVRLQESLQAQEQLVAENMQLEKQLLSAKIDYEEIHLERNKLWAQLEEQQLGSDFNHHDFVLPAKVVESVSSKTEMLDYLFAIFSANGRNLSMENNSPEDTSFELTGLQRGSNLSQIANHLQKVKGMRTELAGTTLSVSLVSKDNSKISSIDSSKAMSAPVPPPWQDSSNSFTNDSASKYEVTLDNINTQIKATQKPGRTIQLKVDNNVLHYRFLESTDRLLNYLDGLKRNTNVQVFYNETYLIIVL